MKKTRHVAKDANDTPKGMETPFIKRADGGVIISIRLQPRSSRNAIDGITGGSLKVRLTAPPVEGEANKAIVEFLSDLLKIKKSAITIASGLKSRNKSVRAEGLSPDDALRLISKAIV